MPNLPSSSFVSEASTTPSHRRGSEQLQSAYFAPQNASPPRRASLGNVAPAGSANEMLRAASAMIAQASSGAEGLHAVSSALLNQAKAQASAAALSPHDGDAAGTTHPQSTPMTRNLSDSANYSAVMSAHIASALETQMTRPQPPTSDASISAAIDPQASLPGPSNPELQMSRIAAQAAAREAQTQWRTQLALRRSSLQTDATTAEASKAVPPAASASAAFSSSSTDAASSSSQTRLNPTQTHAESEGRAKDGADTSDMSVTEYLRFLGLSHIEMPSQGIEQSFGRQRSPGSRYWDATNPHMGFSLSGVPSMPLMPNPPLQMLPPPASPSFRRKQSRGYPWNRHRPSASVSSASSGDASNDFEPNVMSPFPYPFQVVQTPGGTARAGWWVPVSEVPPEKRAEAVKVGDEPSTASALNFDSVTKLASVPEDRTAPGPRHDHDHEAEHLFQPTYRDFTKDEYSTLATAAAYATAALTSIASTPGGSSQSNSLRPLTASEQETIAHQLRAWAGLDGPHAQAEARKALEQRQLHLIHQAIGKDASTAHSAEHDQHNSPEKMDQLAGSEQATRFFPPDFASHYRTQLQALAEGYYTRLHNENLAQAHFAQPSAKQLRVDDLSNQKEATPTRGAHKTSTAETAQLSGANMEDLNAMQPPVLTPTLREGARDPVELLSAASTAAGQEVSSPEVRDQLLQYAHTLYTQGNPQADASAKGIDKLHPTLLPLLHTLHKLHPTHLPILLLLSCAYYAAHNYAGSLWYNNLILRIDPNYVESMSNIGTTLRALGRYQEAESWWWRAVRLRPGYWDAYENLLGVMCSANPPPAANKPDSGEETTETPPSQPRFKEALQLCEHVETHVVGQQSAPGMPTMPLYLPPNLPLTQTPRLQNLFYAKGNLNFVLPELGAVPAAAEYQKAVEVVLSLDSSVRYGLRDLVLATCAVGLLSMGAMLPGTAAAAAAVEVAVALGINPTDPEHAALLASGAFHRFCPGGILALVKLSGDHVVSTLLRLGNGQLPMLLLLPEAAMQLCKVMFAETGGILPALTRSLHGVKTQNAATLQQAQKQAAQTTSTILLTLAKLFQDATASPIAGPHGPLTLGGIPPSTSLLLPLYYLSISMHASASTCNNLGILLSSIPVVTTVINSVGQPQQMNGQALAMQYYTQGLQLDSRHPHIYTNLGSLLKDLGHLNEAIKMYQKAVECNPNFDVALANLGNAIKDQGRTQDSVAYYRRAVQVNPHFPEALCGLVNALLAVCDWNEVYTDKQATTPTPTQESNGSRSVGKATSTADASGWMVDVSELVTKQLRDACHYGAGAFQTAGQIQDWVRAIVEAMGDTRPAAPQIWTQRLLPFYQPGFDRIANQVCEGGYLIQLVERMIRRSQRRWYVDAYGAGMLQADTELPRVTAADQQRSSYARPKLPSCLVTPAVPTVLPFHTFTYPLSPRQIRLICHRNALRISQSTLTQMWVPDVVYPPPSPPAPKINIGYVSSDFNNHPLAHLMQSVFGFHDLSRFNVFLYATTPSDGSPYRQKIEREAQHFLDVSAWSNQQVVERIVMDNIHVLMNLNGYTKGARNEIFAARPCPVQMEFMGFAGSMASRWTDWVVADPIVCPPEMTSVDRWRQQRQSAAAKESVAQQRTTDLMADLDPEEASDEWVYPDRFIYMPHSYFVNDHKQGFNETVSAETIKLATKSIDSGKRPANISEDSPTNEQVWASEELKRYAMRRELFPTLPDDYVIFADFNQLYKCDPMLFKLWLRILKRVPKSILWLLRFPAAGEHHLLREARQYAGDEVASRVIFTDVAPKHIHIHRGRIADLFLDTTECNAHTTAADILWSATPVLTWPRHLHKMCSRVAASIVHATGFGEEMTVRSEEEYEERAVQLAESLEYVYYDERGDEVKAVVDASKERWASQLEADPKSVAAQPHSSGVASTAASAAQGTKTSEQDGNSANGSVASAASSSVMDAAGGKPKNAEHASGSEGSAAKRARSASVLPGSPAPAPTGVSQAEAAKHSDANASTDPRLAASIPPRATIRLPASPDYPGAITRRSRAADGNLAGLRRRLLLTREESKLFDTKQWVRDLEKGYVEAWTRWVLGVDQEDSPEVEGLDPESELGKRMTRSGHIWVKEL